jgi:hypothetical protein
VVEVAEVAEITAEASEPKVDFLAQEDADFEFPAPVEEIEEVAEKVQEIE